ncbi:hypothetical protein HU200_038749 [Digitaria exilis]|uniref:Peptidase C1A papain C-terminal domain-containing protein n=1 Tax=Digitaria exilis TaxID=1010633 RepID=A0A835BBS5_9POAL|nr:hypothetical protein HU200_038749 [Digitaria exilis]
MMDDAFTFIAQNSGIDTDGDYPYTARDRKCDLVKKARRVVSIDGFEDVPHNDEKSLQKAVVHQPVTTAIEAGGREFQLYESGVFTRRCGTLLDHGVLEVRYAARRTARVTGWRGRLHQNGVQRQLAMEASYTVPVVVIAEVEITATRNGAASGDGTRGTGWRGWDRGAISKNILPIFLVIGWGSNGSK